MSGLTGVLEVVHVADTLEIVGVAHVVTLPEVVELLYAVDVIEEVEVVVVVQSRRGRSYACGWCNPSSRRGVHRSHSRTRRGGASSGHDLSN